VGTVDKKGKEVETPERTRVAERGGEKEKGKKRYPSHQRKRWYVMLKNFTGRELQKRIYF